MPTVEGDSDPELFFPPQAEASHGGRRMGPRHSFM
jgi:hypothetical protein